MSILFEGEVYTIIEWQHRQAPKAPPTLTLRLRNVKTGNVFERKVHGNHNSTGRTIGHVSPNPLQQETQVRTVGGCDASRSWFWLSRAREEAEPFEVIDYRL